MQISNPQQVGVICKPCPNYPGNSISPNNSKNEPEQDHLLQVAAFEKWKNNKNLKIMCEKVFLVFRHNQWCFHWPTCSVIFNRVWDEIHFLKDLHHLEWSSHGNWFEQKHPSLTQKTWKCFKRTIKRRYLRYMKYKAGKIVIMIIFKSPKSIWNELIS